MLFDTHIFRPHDLVGAAILENAVLVNTGRMGKSIGAHNGLVGLNRNVHQSTDHAAGPVNLFGVDVSMGLENSGSSAHGHYYLFH